MLKLFPWFSMTHRRKFKPFQGIKVFILTSHLQPHLQMLPALPLISEKVIFQVTKIVFFTPLCLSDTMWSASKKCLLQSPVHLANLFSFFKVFQFSLSKPLLSNFMQRSVAAFVFTYFYNSLTHRITTDCS